MLNSPEAASYEASYDTGLNQEKSHFSNTRKILLKQEFSDGFLVSMNIKDITIPLINSLLFTESIQNTTPNLHAKS